VHRDLVALRSRQSEQRLAVDLGDVGGSKSINAIRIGGRSLELMAALAQQAAGQE